MAVAQVVRMQNVANRKVDAAFAEYERCYKEHQAISLNVTNLKEAKERLVRTIERKERELKELEIEIDSEMERTANNLHNKREIEAIRADIRAKTDEIEDKKRLLDKRKEVIERKTYGELTPYGCMEYKLNKRAEYAKGQPETLVGSAHLAAVAKRKFLDLHYQQKLKQFIQKFKDSNLVDLLHQLLVMKPEYFNDAELYWLGKNSFAIPAGISNTNEVANVDHLGRALKSIFSEFVSEAMNVSYSCDSHIEKASDIVSGVFNVPISSPEEIRKWYKTEITE